MTGRRLHLWSYLTLIVTAFVGVAMTGYGAYTADEQAEHAKTRIVGDAKLLADSIASAASGHIADEAYDRIEDLLLRFARLSSVRQIQVFDGAGRPISAVRRDGVQLPRAEFGLAPITPPDTRQDTFEGNDFIVFQPIEAGRPIGWLRTITSLEGLDAIRQHIWRDTAIVTVAAVLLLSVILGLALQRATTPLSDATEFAKSLSSHRGEQFFPRSRIMEIEALAETLNQVSANLRQQHEALRESEALKKAVQDVALDCVIIIDRNGNIVDFNPAAENTFGYRSEDVVGKPLSQTIIPPAMRAAHEAGMEHYRRTHYGPVLGTRLEVTATRQDGSEFPVELAIVPVELTGQSYFCGYLRDISEKKALEEDRKRANERLEQSLRDLANQKFALDEHAIVSITDAAGTILYANEKFSEISGYSNQELLGRNHRLINSGTHHRQFFETMWSSISSGKTWHGEIANRRKDGSLYWVASTIVPLLDKNDLPYQYISIRTDITAQKETEVALADARRRELETGNQIQNSLLLGTIPDIASVEIAAFSAPSQGIDGDFFEFFRFDENCFDVLIGDVMGKGIPAALMGAGVKSHYNRVLLHLLTARANGATLPSPANIVNLLHKRLTGDLIRLDAFVTLAYYRVDLTHRTLTYVDAGHPPAILVSGHGAASMLSGDNLPIGIDAGERYAEHCHFFEVGDLLLLYSDGVTEARDASGEQLGSVHLSREVLKLHVAGVPPALLLQCVREAVSAFDTSDRRNDDFTTVAILHAGKTGSVQRRVFARALTELGNLRAWVGSVSAGRLPEEGVSRLVLAAVETASNLIRHAGPRVPDAGFLCHLDIGSERVQLDFYYLGKPFDPSRAPEPDFSGTQESGFGVYIIEHAVDEVRHTRLADRVNRVSLLMNADLPGTNISPQS